jgi:hypothetical protein
VLSAEGIFDVTGVGSWRGGVAGFHDDALGRMGPRWYVSCCLLGLVMTGVLCSVGNSAYCKWTSL